MRKETYTINGCEIERISKKKARELFNAGQLVWMLPCNLNLYSPWVAPIAISKYMPMYESLDFDTITIYAELMNCNNESGKYLKYLTVHNPEECHQVFYDKSDWEEI